MKHMADVGVRALKQNASAVVADVAAGAVVTITDRGRPVARLVPLQGGALADLVASGRARAPKRRLRDLPEPIARGRGQRSLSDALREEREAERY